jgi:hypothetical protein
MASECFNLYSFFGNEKVIEKVREWKILLNKFQPTDEDKFCTRAIREVFYPDMLEDEEIDMGSNWVHQSNMMSPNDNQIGLASAWSPPNELQKKIACLLYELDNHVVIKNDFSTEGSTFGVSYATPYDSKNVYFEEAEVDDSLDDDFEDEDEDEDDEAREEAENRANEELKELESQLIENLISDVEGTKEVMKKFMPDLDINWDDYE